MGYSIKKARCSAMMTQAELADKSGLTQQYIYKLESGKLKNPTREVMIKIAKALNVSIQDLFFSEE